MSESRTRARLGFRLVAVHTDLEIIGVIVVGRDGGGDLIVDFRPLGSGSRVRFRFLRHELQLVPDELLHLDQHVRDLLPPVLHRCFDEPEPFHGDGEKRVRHHY